MKEIDCPLPNARAYKMGACRIMVERHWMKERGVDVQRWHLSISCAERNPTYEEIKRARYELIPDEATMAMIFPPKSQFVNIHEYCFHLHEIEGE